VPEARVEEAADAGSRVLGRVLGRQADQPGERDEGGRRENEERDVAGPRQLVDRDHEGGGKQRRPEELPEHRASLKSGHVGMTEACPPSDLRAAYRDSAAVSSLA